MLMQLIYREEGLSRCEMMTTGAVSADAADLP